MMEHFSQVVCTCLNRGMSDGATMFGSGVAICASLFLATALGFI